MKQLAALYLGVLALVVASFVGLVKIPGYQFLSITPRENEQGDYPVEPWGDIRKGRDQYIGLGCIYCHSQQIRPKGFGADIKRGWGDRRTVSTDYLFDDPPLLGTMRTGPDLAAIGVRQPSADWHYLHLYDPEITSPGSNMPKFPFLFDVTTDPLPSTTKIELRKENGQTVWLVPKPPVQALVSYLLNLDKTMVSWPKEEK